MPYLVAIDSSRHKNTLARLCAGMTVNANSAACTHLAGYRISDCIIGLKSQIYCCIRSNPRVYTNLPIGNKVAKLQRSFKNSLEKFL